MLRPDHPEVLVPDWTPPVLIGRQAALVELAAELPLPPTRAGGTRVACVRGPGGSGVSSVARRAALELVERLRRRAGEPVPVHSAIRIPWTAGPRGVAGELMRALDSSFEPRGFPIAELMAGFLRRLTRGRRSAVVVFDDLRASAPDLAPVLRPLLAPDRFLPEGIEWVPPLWVLLAGTGEPAAVWDRAGQVGVPVERAIRLAPYSEAELRAIVSDRAQRALGRPAPEGWAGRFAAAAASQGTGARRAMELLRRELAEPRAEVGPEPGPPGMSRSPLPVEPRLLDALERAAGAGPTLLSTVRDWETRLAHQAGVRPLATTTLWRRIVRLEAAGVLRREVRTGGEGGSQSRLELVRPLGPRPIATGRLGMPRGAGPSAALRLR
jgi:hypothetical protein